MKSPHWRVVQFLGLDEIHGSGYLSVLHFHVIGSPGDSSVIDITNGILSRRENELFWEEDGFGLEIQATWIGDLVSIPASSLSYHISVSPLTVDFGSILPGGDISGTDLTITDFSSPSVKITAEIADDLSGFYTSRLH